MATPDLAVFISYVHEDSGISDALNNAFQNAFGEKIKVFLDKVSIQQSDNIRDALEKNLDASDVLVVISTGTERPSHDWAGWELGHFGAAHRRPPDNRPLWGSIFTICARGCAPRPEGMRKYLEIDVGGATLEQTVEQYRATVEVPDDDPFLMWFGQLLLAVTGERLDGMAGKRDQFRRIIKDLKVKIFEELKRRPKVILKPQKQLTIRYDSTSALRAPDVLSAEATITLHGGAAAVFGIPGTKEGAAISWGKFCDLVKNHTVGKYWTGTLVRMLVDAVPGSVIDVDRGELISSHDQQKLYRLILTTSITYYNHLIDASIYMVEVYRRKDAGNPVTTLLVKGLQLVTRFRFLFLERGCEFHHVNVQLSEPADLEKMARRIIHELDLMLGDSYEANLHQPSAWTGILSVNQIMVMANTWVPLRDNLVKHCVKVIEAPDKGAIEDARCEMAATLEKIQRAVGPQNSALLEAIASKLISLSKEIDWNGQAGDH